MISPPSTLPDSDSQDTDTHGPNGSKDTQNTSSAKLSLPLQPESSKPGSTFTALRKALKEDSNSPDTIIRAAAESARAQTGADGVAIALRARGAVVCRARSGDLAPEVGSQLNAHSGFSGECLRTASILLCHDTENDARVDPEVCRIMGIRSMVAVPLRGAIGIAGILEAFSSRPGAFGDEQINWLRELAQVAESAYEKERLAHEEKTMASLSSPRRLSALFTRASAADPPTDPTTAKTDTEVMAFEDESYESFPPRRYWVVGVATIALLMVLGIWLSWREPDLTETVAAAKPQTTAVQAAASSGESSTSQAKVVPIANKGGATLDVLRKASGLERSSEITRESSPVMTGAAKKTGNTSSEEPSQPESASGVPADRPNSAEPAATASNEAPPAMTIATADPGPLTELTSRTTTPMPTMEVQISQGVTQAELIHKVNPVYPLQARTQRIAGAVVLEITIAEDGTVRKVKKVSGESILVGAATQAVRQWRYSPILLNGKPVQAERQVSILFKLP